MNTLDKMMLVVFALVAVAVTIVGLTAIHYYHVEKMTDKHLEFVKLEKMCIDD